MTVLDASSINTTTMKLAHRPIPGLAVLALALTLSSCQSCEVPPDPVLPVDLSGYWAGSYTLYDGTGRALTDSLLLQIRADAGQLRGEGVRKRFLPEMAPVESEVDVLGTVVVNTFRIELVDPATRNRAVYSGKAEGDTLSGRLTVEGVEMGELRMVGYRTDS